MYNPVNMYPVNNMYQCPYYANMPMFSPEVWQQFPNQYIPYIDQAEAWAPIQLKDYGPNPFVININEATKQNNYFRIALWTGNYLQLTLMSINVGEDIGLEMHPNLDQFIRIEQGQGLVKMGDRKDMLDFRANVRDDFAIIIPAGKWHNLINTGNKPLKLYSIYAPPQHPYGTVHETREDAEENHRR
jgi:mannose-6-phosphate isomerase-like protein (cupin superfamily)